MVKTKTKKIVTKKTRTPKYELTLSFNGEDFNVKTNNIRKSILAMKPEMLYTEIFMNLKTKDAELDKHFNLVQGKRLFASEEMMDVIISNLLF